MIVYMLALLLHIGMPEVPRRFTAPSHAPIHTAALPRRTV